MRHLRNRSRRRIKEARFGHKHLFYDQSVLGRLIGNSRNFIEFTDRFICNLRDHGMCNDSNIPLILDTTSLIELIGIRSELPKQQDYDKEINNLFCTNESIENYKSKVFNYFDKACQNIPALKKEMICNKINKQKEYASERGQILLDQLQKAWSRDRKNSICTAIAFDRMYGFKYPKNLEYEVACSFFIDIVRSLSKGFNVNQCRGMHTIYEAFANSDHVETLKANANPVLSQLSSISKEIIKDIRFEENKDLVDASLIHYSTIGFFSNMNLESVICFTCDNRKQVEKRVAAYKTAYTFIYEEARSFGKKYKAIKPRYGTIVFLNTKGDFESILHVKDVQDVLKMHLENQ